MDELTERRAEFVYEGARLAALGAQAPIVPAHWLEREAAFRAQFLEVIDLQCGPWRSVCPRDLHDTWTMAYIKMGWVYGEMYDKDKKTHPDMVPYSHLGKLEQDKDAVFMALCDIARKFFYKEGIHG